MSLLEQQCFDHVSSIASFLPLKEIGRMFLLSKKINREMLKYKERNRENWISVVLKYTGLTRHGRNKISSMNTLSILRQYFNPQTATRYSIGNMDNFTAYAFFVRNKWPNLRTLELTSHYLKKMPYSSHLVNLRSLSLWCSIEDVRFISSLPLLQSLELNCSATVLPVFPQSLLRLDVHQINFTSIEIQNITTAINLQELKIGGIRVTEYHIIGELISLKSLTLYGFYYDIRYLSKLINLEYLYIDFRLTNAIELASISCLTRLKTLMFGTVCKEIDNISHLSTLVNLEELDILFLDNVSSVDVFSYLTKLKKLAFSSKNVTDLPSLRYLENLQELRITHFKRMPENVPFLSTLTRLKLYSYSIADFSFVSEMKNLVHLLLQGGEIKTEWLLELKKLEDLRLRQIYIDSIVPITTLTNLKVLDLEGSTVTDISPLIVLPNLEKLRVNNPKLNYNVAIRFPRLKVLKTNLCNTNINLKLFLNSKIDLYGDF